MSIDYSGFAISKGVPRKLAKGRRLRMATATIRTVRAKCVDRDGACRLSGLVGCSGPSEWAHLGDYRRFNTRGQSAERRHTTVGSLMLCEAHHDAYDGHQIDIRPATDRGADGLLAVKRDGFEVFV